MDKSIRIKPKKNIIIISCLICIALLCLSAVWTTSVKAASGNNDEIASYIYDHTQIATTDTDWQKYIKNTFASETNITSASSGNAIKWATVPSSGVSAPWNGTALGVTDALPTTHTGGTAELVVSTETNSGIQTKTYTQYTPSSSSGNPDKATVHLKIQTDTSDAGALPEYHVYTGEALLYAMNMFTVRDNTKNGGSLYLEQDIDLNGQYHYWPGANMVNKQQFHGNGHTIYNLCVVFDKINPTLVTNNHRTGFVLYMDDGGVFENVIFDNAYIVGCSEGTSDANYGGYGTAIITYAEDSTTIEKVKVNKSMIVGSYQAAPIVSRVQITGSSTGPANISNCSTKGCTVFGIRHEGSLTGSLLGRDASVRVNVDHCYSTDCNVFSTLNHSGGLFSCGNFCTLTDCFTNVRLYGSYETGVFIGAVGDYCTIENCFASGFIEGYERIGGFVGAITARCNFSATNCYSTALTGLRTGGKFMGGFVGHLHNVDSANFTNCYAAGEVGSVDTDTTPPSIPPATGIYPKQKQSCGGFIGASTSGNATQTEFKECYYDKQTTAMREWDVGEKNNNDDYDDIVGVLTTDTSKSGNGLTSETFREANGFSQFTSEKWSYSAKQHYPELSVFKDANPTTWGSDEAAALVKAYSLSSTSTLMLDTWDKGLNTETGKFTETLPYSTYCTVRDLTSGFDLTSFDVDKWDQIETQDNNGTGKAKSIIEGEEYDVLSLKHQNNAWLCDELVPGIEWLKVTCKDSSQSATRRIRIIPTAGLNAGASDVIMGKYDHADDVELYYSTGSRMATSVDDITTGIYPDKDGEANAITARQIELMDGVDMSGANDVLRGADVSYMSNGTTDNAINGKLYVYAYPITGFNGETNKVELGALINFSENNNAQKFNGYVPFDNLDERFLISYMWTLNDGRVIQDAKIVRRAKLPFDVNLNLYKNSISDENRYATGGYLYTGVNATNTATPILTDFTGFDVANRIKPTSTSTADFKEHAQTAWKLADNSDVLTSIKVTVSFSDSEKFSTAISGSDITPGKVISVPCIERRIVYKDGVYYTIPESVTRDYTLQYEAANGVWYLNFEKTDASSTSTEGHVFRLNDVETNIIVDVVAKSKNAEYAITGQKTLVGDRTSFGDNAFSFKLTEDTNNDKSGYSGFTGKAQLSSDGTISFDTLNFSKAGTYKFIAKEEGSSHDGYIYDTKPVVITITVMADDKGFLTATSQFEKESGGTELAFENRFDETLVETPSKPPQNLQDDLTETGDRNNLWILVLMMAISAAGVAVTITIKRQ